MPYWSENVEEPWNKVFHTCENCPKGRQILGGRKGGDKPPKGYKKCKECADHEARGTCE